MSQQDVPKWAKGNRPYKGESGKDFAKRLMDEKYGAGNYKTGPGSEYNQIKNGVIVVLNKEEIIEFYPINFKVNQTEYCTLWYTDEIDGFLQDEDKKIKFFANVGEAKAFTESKGYSIDSEVLQITDDIFKKLDVQILDCNVILTCWNILSDMAKTIDCDFLGDSKAEEIQKF